MIICSGNNITKNFAGSQLFTNIAFQIQEGSRTGLVGSNGCGKTTLLNIISKKEHIDSGQLAIRNGAKVGYVQQIPEFEQDIQVIDVLKKAFFDVFTLEKNMKEIEIQLSNSQEDSEKLLLEYGEKQMRFEELGGYVVDVKIESVLNGLGLNPLRNHLFSQLSGGEKTKVNLALVLLQETDILLLDEPTNHLDIEAIEWLSRYMKEYTGTIIVVSHDRYFLDECITNIIEIEDGECTNYHGNYSYYVEEKEKRLLAEFHHYEEQQKKIKKMKEAIKRLREWANQANPPNEGLFKRAKSMEKALDRMEKLKRPQLERKKIGLEFQKSNRSGKDVLSIESLTLAFNDIPIFQDLSLLLQYGERVALMGGNGAGKTSLLKVCLGEISDFSGVVKMGNSVKLGYLSQHYVVENEKETVIEAFRNHVAVNEQEARNILAKFLFYGGAVFRKVSELSGGERMRLRLAELMHQDCNLLILDEPTNHLDIDSKEVLEESLEEFAGTILSVSHDRYFINRLFTNIYWLENGSITKVLGNYEDVKEKFIANKWQKPKIEVEKKRNDKPKPSTKTNELKEIELEQQIIKLESEIEKEYQVLEIEESYETLQSMYTSLEEKKITLTKMYEEWDQLITK